MIIPTVLPEGEECLNVTVSTFNSNKYDYLASAKTMKAKLKLPDEVLQALCQNEMPRRWVIVMRQVPRRA